MAHYTVKPKSQEPDWGDVDKTTLPMRAFAYPHALVLSGKMTEKEANDLGKSRWKLPHHYMSGGQMYAHRNGVVRAIQAIESGFRGQFVDLPSGAKEPSLAHLKHHQEVFEIRDTKEEVKKLFAEYWEIRKDLDKDSQSMILYMMRFIEEIVRYTEILEDGNVDF